MSPENKKDPVILVVDDTEDNLDLLEFALKRKPVEMLRATSGKECLMIANDKQPDVILLDIQMPEMDGFETLKHLKANPATTRIPVIFLTAYHLLKTLAPVRRGETVLIHAAASGVGTVAVQLAKAWGARVFATASTEEKLALARTLGADECINYEKQDFLAEVMRRTDGVGVDRVLECVGGDVLVKSVTALAPGGRLMIYGRASGSLPTLAPDEFFARNLHVIGLNIGGKPWTQAVHRAALEDCLALIAAGKAKPVISATWPLAQVARAHEYLANRQTMGKVILTP